jgi:hypothetical protein
MLLEYEPKLFFFEKLIAQQISDKESIHADASVASSQIGEEFNQEQEVFASENDSEDDALEHSQDHEQNLEEQEEDLEEQEEDLEEEGLDLEDLEEQDYNGVDDDFFSLNEMEKFANVMDKRDDESAGSDMEFIDSGEVNV